jgi:hypothetical protein
MAAKGSITLARQAEEPAPQVEKLYAEPLSPQAIVVN